MKQLKQLKQLKQVTSKLVVIYIETQIASKANVNNKNSCIVTLIIAFIRVRQLTSAYVDYNLFVSVCVNNNSIY